MNIIEKLNRKFDQAELMTVETEEMKINLENRNLQDFIAENLQRRSLRVIDEGRLGVNSAYGSSKKVIAGLIKGAEESVCFGDKAYFDFSTQSIREDDTNAPRNFSDSSPEVMVEFAQDIINTVEGYKKNLTFNLKLKKEKKNITIQTTAGANSQQQIINYSLIYGAPIPGGGSQLYRAQEQPSFFGEIPETEIKDFLSEYEKSTEVSVPQTARMPVLFSPRSLYFFPISFQEGISARNIFRGTSPLSERCGDEIFSDKIVISDRPDMTESGNRRKFDDEGVPAEKRTIVENGVLKGFIYDLEHAARMDAEPTGNGLKEALFGSGIDTPVTPALINPVIEPGNSCKKELIESIEEGILVEDVIGFHSSNYPQGHFSVQAHGFHIQNGELKGRLEDVMIAGNIYEDFKRIEGIGDRLYPTYKGYLPYLLVDGIMVSAH